jgi:hypothetical protein
MALKGEGLNLWVGALSFSNSWPVRSYNGGGAGRLIVFRTQRPQRETTMLRMMVVATLSELCRDLWPVAPLLRRGFAR